MLKSELSDQILAPLRLKDNAYEWTYYFNLQTPPQIIENSLAFLLQRLYHFNSNYQIFSNQELLLKTSFHVRSFFCSYLNTIEHSQMTQTQFMKLGLSCIILVLQKLNYGQKAQNIKQSFLEPGEFQGYFPSDEYSMNQEQLNNFHSDSILQATTPLQFVQVAIEQEECKTAVREIIKLSLITLEISKMTAFTVFVGSCIFLCELKEQPKAKFALQEQFPYDFEEGLQLGQLLKTLYEPLSVEPN